MLPVRRPLHLPLGVTASLAKVTFAALLDQRVPSPGADPEHPDNRYAPANQRRPRMLCGESVLTAVHEGIEADVRFIQLDIRADQSEP